MAMFNSTKKGKYNDLRMEYKMLQKIMTEDLLPKRRRCGSTLFRSQGVATISDKEREGKCA